VRHSELRFRLVTEAATDAIWDWNLLTGDLWWNEGVTTIFGYTPEETAGGITWWEGHLHPEDHDRVLSDLQAVIDSGRIAWSDEYRFRRADGTYADVYDRGSVIHDASKRPVRMIGGMTDITRRKQAEQILRERLEVERMLLQELDHRVRNNLTALLSLVDMTRRSVDDIEGFADRITGRVRAMASVHGLLSDSRWGSLRLQSLITSIAPAECIKRICVEGDDEPIPSRQVTGLAMVLHELMTNSLKHGALSVPDGRLNISWSVAKESAGDARTLTIRWREQGGPEVQNHPAPSVGMELIDGLTRTELRGHAELSFPRGGADHTLSITLDETEHEGVPGLGMNLSVGPIGKSISPFTDHGTVQ
jgi:PAS domain S-box-containing protein